MSNTPLLANNSSVPQTRRLKVRQTLGTLAYLDIGPDNGGIILNLSEDGLAFQAVAPLHGLKQIQMVVQLPHSDTHLEMASEIVWLAASAREGGVRFLNISTEARAQIRHWIESQASPEADASRPDATAAEATTNAGEQQPLIPQRDIPGDSRREKWLGLMQDFERDVLRQERSPFDAVKTSTEGVFQPTHPALKLVPVPAPKPEIVRPSAPVSTSAAQTGLRDSTPETPLSVKPSADSLGVGLPSFRRQALQNTSSAPSTTPPSFPPNQGNRELPAEPDGDDRKALTSYVSLPRPAFDLEQGDREPAISKSPRDRLRNDLAVVVSFVLFCVLCFEIGTWVGNLRVRSAARLAAPTPPAANIAGQNAPPSGKVDPKSDVRVSIPRAVETRAHAKALSKTMPHRAPAMEPAASFAQQRSVPPSSSPPTSSPSLFTSSATVQAAVNATVPTPSPAAALPENPAPRVIDGHVLQPSDRFVPCHLTYRVDPTYPADAQHEGIQGTVKIHLVIAADGSVQSEQLISGPPQLVSAALEAARYWRYLPALLNGQPISTEQDIEIAFQLHR
jgi:TonB family protein